MAFKKGSWTRTWSRRLHLESLESRTLLAALWQNPVNRLDVDNSGQVTPMDALVVINDLVRNGGAHPLSTPDSEKSPPPYLDVNGNDFVEPVDALVVINALNADPMSESYFIQRFLVNVQSGDVQLRETPLFPSDGSEGETTFVGTSIQFNTSPLLEQPGNTGRKVINVSLTNRTGETIGQMPGGTFTGLRVLFSDFANVGVPSDLKTKTTVGTLAGNGAVGSSDGLASNASFWSPYGVVVDPAGEIYVADSQNYKIRKLSGNVVSTLAGSGAFGGADGSGAAASFQFPFSIARNAVDGSLIVSDFGGHRIRRVTPDGEVTTVAGTGTAGDTNGSGTVATFRSPAGVAVSSDGTIFVVEANGHRIRRIVQTGSDPRLPSSYTVSVFAGSTASPPVTGTTDDMGTAARFNNPRGITVDLDGTLYVAELGNRKIRRITPGAQVVTIAGTGTSGSADGLGHVATFNAPQGIVAIPGKNTLLVSNSGGQTVRQLKLRDGSGPGSPTSWEVTTIAGDATTGAVDGRGDVASFSSPIGLTLDNSGNLLVADSANNKLRRLTPANGFFPLGIPSASPSSEPIQLSNPDGVVPTANPVLAVTNPVSTGQRPFIRYEGALAPGATTAQQGWSFVVPDGVTAFEFTVTVEANTTFLAAPFSVSNPGPSGVGSPLNVVRTVAGNGLGGFVDGLATEAKFNYISGIAVDGQGNRYVADKFNHSIRRVSRDGIVSTVAGMAGRGAGSVDGVGSVAQFTFPENLAVTADGQTIYVADTGNHTVRRISLTPSSDPTRPENWNVSTIAGSTGTLGYVDATTGTAARFNAPGGIAVSESGVVYLTEMNGNRVRQLMHTGGDPSFSQNWRVTLVAGSTAGAVGTIGTDDGLGSVARFNQPHQIAVDRAGVLYVADTSNHRIRRIWTDSTVTTLAGSTSGYRDDVGTSAQFSQPYGVAVDSAGYVYVADTAGQRIRRISPVGVVTTIAGGSPTGLVADQDGTGDLAQFYQPLAVAVDAAGSLHVTAGGSYQFIGGSSVTGLGLRIRMIERIITVGEP